MAISDIIEYWEKRLKDKKMRLKMYSSKMVKEQILKEIEEIEEIIKQLKKEGDSNGN